MHRGPCTHSHASKQLRHRAHSRGCQAKREVQQVVLVLARPSEGIVRLPAEDDVACGAREGALARALESDTRGVCDVQKVLPLKALGGRLDASLVDERHMHAAEGDAREVTRHNTLATPTQGEGCDDKERPDTVAATILRHKHTHVLALGMTPPSQWPRESACRGARARNKGERSADTRAPLNTCAIIIVGSTYTLISIR